MQGSNNDDDAIAASNHITSGDNDRSSNENDRDKVSC